MGTEVLYGGVRIDFEVDFVELSRNSIAAEGLGAIPPQLAVVPAEQSLPKGPQVHTWSSDGHPCISLYRNDAAYVLEFENGGRYSFDADALTVSCPPEPTSFDRHQLLDQVLPRVLDHLGYLMLHASAVRTTAGDLLFVADTGAGKSTLAVAASQAGAGHLISDDCVRIDTGGDAVRSTATYASLRLHPDSIAELCPDEPAAPLAPGATKHRVELRQPPSQSGDVAVLFVLRGDDGSRRVKIAALPPARAVAALVGQCFRLDPTDAVRTEAVLDHCAQIAERVPVVELVYPQGYDRLAEVCRAVIDFTTAL